MEWFYNKMKLVSVYVLDAEEVVLEDVDQPNGLFDLDAA